MEKSLINSFDAGYCYRDTELSEAIRFATRSNISHTVHFRWIDAGLFVYDAQIDGYNPKPYDEWMEKYGYKFFVMRNPNATESWLLDCIRREAELKGKPYDLVSLIVRKPTNIVRAFLNKFRTKPKRLWKDEDELKRVFCSEATAYVIGCKDIDLTPQELFTWCSLNGWKKVVDSN